MKALLSHEPGPPETLRLDDVPEPTPGPGELLVRVRAEKDAYLAERLDRLSADELAALDRAADILERVLAE